MPSPNLVQIQRDLQMLPPGPQTMMYLKRAKDGMVASVPPYLAAAELAGREKMAQRQAMSDGAVPGEQPTVSQQLSQKADLLALQAMKKQAMEQQSANQAREAVMPAPEGTPEPEEQPRREGGIDQLPVDFGLAGGGIVAFQEGGVPMTTGYAPEYQEARALGIDLSPYDSPEERKAKLERLARMREFRKQAGTAQIPGQAADVQALAAQMNKPPAPPAPPVKTSTMTPQQIEAQVKKPQVAPPAPPAEPPAAAPAAPTPTEQLRAALMGRLGMGGPQGEAVAAIPGAEPTGTGGLTQAGQDVKALAAMMGLGTPAGAEEREMIAQMRARQAQREKERQQMGLDAVLRGFSRGRGGASAAYEEAANRAYAEDTQHQQQMYNLINAINTGNRKEAEKAFDKAIGLGESREKEVGAMSRSQLQALSQMYSSELQAGSSKYNTDAHVRVALAQAERAGRSNDLQERKLAVDGLQTAERGVQSELNKLQGKLDPESRRDRAKLEDNLKALRTRISALSGADKLAPVAAPPGTDPTAPTQGRARFLGYEK
jgi:hypothetical protein